MEELPCDMFELRIVPQVEQLWEQLGLDESQRNEQVAELTDHFQQMYLEFVATLQSQVQEAKEEITAVHMKHRQAMKAFGVSEDEINEQIPQISETNLIDQLDASKLAFSNFQNVISERLQKLENLVCIANESFDLLGIPEEDRGEFNELGETDFTRERIERFRAKISELNEQKESRMRDFESVKESINVLLNELNEELDSEDSQIIQSPSLSLDHLTKVDELKTKFENLKQERVKKISECAITITHLWDLLEVNESERTRFLKSHTTLGSDVLRSCERQIAELSAKRDAKLPELIALQRTEVAAFWEDLHIAIESRPRFVPDPSDNETEKNVKEFEFLESEVIRLKQLKVQLNPIIELVNQREDIVREYNETMQATSDPNRLTSRAKGYAQQLMKEEKARRRYKVSLPRLEKKLYQLLCEHKRKHGTEFEWDGRPYVEQLADDAKVEEKPKKIAKTKKKAAAKLTAQTLPASPRRKVLFEHNENANSQGQKSFSIRDRSPIKLHA